MFEYIKDGLSVFRQGEAIAAAAKVKNWTNVINGTVGLLGTVMLIAKTSGHDIPLTNSDLATLGSAALVILGVLNPVSATITSDKIGLPAKRISNPLPVIDQSRVESVQPVSQTSDGSPLGGPSVG